MSPTDDALEVMAQQLLTDIAQGGESDPVDETLLATAESLIQGHQLYVQLLFVNMIISRVRSLESYFAAMDIFVDEINAEDSPEMTAVEKLRGIQAITTAIKSQLDMVSTMQSSREASGALISTLRENVGSVPVSAIPEETDNVLDTLKTMDPSTRQRVLKGTIEAMRKLAEKEVAS